MFNIYGDTKSLSFYNYPYEIPIMYSRTAVWQEQTGLEELTTRTDKLAWFQVFTYFWEGYLKKSEVTMLCIF